MKSITGIVAALLLSFNIHAQPGVGKECYFAVGLFTSAHSSMLTYAIVTFQNGQMVGAKILSEQQFMYEAMGHWPSAANPARKNLFYLNGVDSCLLIKNDFDKVIGYYAKPFYDLWRIRFYEHPMDFDNRGWSQGQYKPSLYQMRLLQEQYGITNALTDYIYGDSLFKLLRNVQDPEWIYTYKSVGPDTTATDTTSAP